MKGYKVGFTHGDRPFREILVDINNIAVNGNNVSFDVDFGLRDASGNYDDPYEGFVEVLVIADVA